MLVSLAVRGLGPIADAEVRFSKGLNVLSGESGAGKSLFLSALALLSGASAPRGLAGACVAAEFDLGQEGRELAKRLGLDAERLPVSRALGGRGVPRARVEIGGRVSSLAELGDVTAELLSLTTQGSVPALASGAGVLSLLDARAGTLALSREVMASVAELRRARGELAALVERAAKTGENREQLLEIQAELAALEPEPGEYGALARRLEVLERAQHYLELLASVSNALSEREEPIERELARLLQAVRRAPLREPFAQLESELAAASDAVAAASREAERVARELDCEPATLEHARRRHAALARLAARLGCSPDELSEGRRLLDERLAELDSFTSRRAELERVMLAAEANAERLAARLHAARAAVCADVERQLRAELRALALSSAEVRLGLERTPAELSEGSRLDLRFSANPGIALEPLSRVASGGERARFALALCCLGALRGITVVLDEIDQGVGGEAVEAMAERLQRLGRTQQVVCVTHKAAIAARADAHFRVEKAVVDGRSIARITELDDRMRTQELSRMLAGASAPTASRALARRLLEAARRAA